MRNRIVITNVCLVDGVDEPRHADVLIENGHFAAFQQPGTLSEIDAEAVSGEGLYLIPGLWESHTHLMMGVDGSTADKVSGVKDGLQTYLTRGITSVVDLGCPESVMTEVRSEIRNEQHKFPSLYFSGPVFTGVNGWPLCMTCDHTSSWEVTPSSPVESMVAGLAPKTDFIKIIYDGLPGGADKLPHEALSRAVRAAHDHGKRVMVHVRSKNDLVEAVEAGADCIEHIFQPETPESLREAEDAADLMAKHGVFWCPTLTTYEQISSAGSIPYLERLLEDGIITAAEMTATRANPFYHQGFPRVSAGEALARLDYGTKTLRLFADRGVRIVAGSDVAIAMSRPGALLRELQLFVQAGLDAAAVIRSATVNAADRLGLPTEGSDFRAGAVADAILVNANPLASIDALVRSRHIVKVFKAGVPVDRV